MRGSSMSEPVEVPPYLQEQLAKLQQLQQTLQIIVNQKQQVEFELTDTTHALDELQKLADDAVVFKSIGALLIKKDRPSLVKELSERKELLNVRLSVLVKQEEKTREKLRELEQEIQTRLRPAQAS
ncbi:MAG: prefoldin subunit beta [Candidatus Bathyarchaeia archaeon]